jgi:hypothetical protein
MTLFYEGSEPGLNPPGLFDYSKGQLVTAIQESTPTVAWSNGNLIASAYTTRKHAVLSIRKVLVAMSGFSSTGAGKLNRS